MNKKQCNEVTIKVLQEVVLLDIELIAAPHLRELVCSSLTQSNLVEFRNKYTRLGLPYNDVKKLLSDDIDIRRLYKIIGQKVFEQYEALS